jgi:L-iditol 2-dehydrogenase
VKGASASQPGQIIITDFELPALREGDLILRTLACGICATDVKLVQKGSKETTYALGHELAGRVVDVGKGSSWKVGQRVIAAPYLPCGECYACRHDQPTLCANLFETSIQPGGLSEQVYIPAALAQRGMFAIPDSMPDEIAALAEPLGCVIKGLDDAHLHSGDTLLVIGDGPMGLLAAGAGKHMGALHVMVAGMTEHRLNSARYFADTTIDVSREDLRNGVDAHTQERGADVVIVAVSSGEALATGIAMVRAGGWVNAFAGVPEGTEIALDVRKLHYQQYHLTGSFGTAPEHMKKALDMLAAQKVDFSPIISAHYPFERVVDAVEHVEKRIGLKAMVTFKEDGG